MPDTRETVNTWEATGRHVIRADVDERRRISNGSDELNVYLGHTEKVSDSNHDRKLKPKESIVVDQTVHLYGYGPWVTTEHTDEKAEKLKQEKPRKKAAVVSKKK